MILVFRIGWKYYASTKHFDDYRANNQLFTARVRILAYV